jgi:hypothetical protein
MPLRHRESVVFRRHPPAGNRGCGRERRQPSTDGAVVASDARPRGRQHRPITHHFDGRKVIVELDPASEITVIQPAGTHTVRLTAADNPPNPNSVAVKRTRVYVASAGHPIDQNPKLLITRF